MGGSGSPLTTLLNLQVGSSRRSVMLSVQTMAGFAGTFVGSLVLGFLAERVSIPFAWGLAAALLLGSVPLLLKVDRMTQISDISF